MSRIGRNPLVAATAALGVVALLALTNSPDPTLRADEQEEIAVSSFAPIDDLVAETAELVGTLDKVVAGEREYQRRKKLAARDAYTLAIVAHAVSEHEKKGEVAWGDKAALLRDAALAWATAKDFAAAQSAQSQIKNLVGGGAKPAGEAQQLKWNQLAPLNQVMPVVNARNLRGVRIGLRKKRPDTARHATIIALLARVAREDRSVFEVAEPAGDVAQWVGMADKLRLDYADLAKNIREHKVDDPNAALKTATATCADCHKVFRPDLE